MKIFINESQYGLISEAVNDKFDLNVMDSLRSYNKRVQYCRANLGREIGKGSSRIVFQLDDEKILKLAFNEKGKAQNCEEERAYGNDIFPKVFGSAEDDSWLISEFVLPANSADFKHCFGMSFNEFKDFIIACGKYRFGKQFRYYRPNLTEDEYVELVENNQDLYDFDDYIGNYGDIVCGDMMRIKNYGLANRDGEAHIVLLDSGFTDYVWDNYYKRG